MQISFDAYEVKAHIYGEVAQRFGKKPDLAHGWDHVRRVYELALHIAEQEHADLFIVGMAALMHDLGRTIEHEEGGTHHADLSVQLARQLLTSHTVPVPLCQQIEHAILAHSFSRKVQPRTLEAKIVRDADRLDALGAIGVMRWAIVSQQRSTAGLQPYHGKDPFAEQRTPDDRQYMLDHFYCKLLKLSETMNTETARDIAERRTSFMRLYLDELRCELEVYG